MTPAGFGPRLAALVLLTAPAFGQEPGDLYREWEWRAVPWQRVTGSDASDPRARASLPNPVNTISMSSLAAATRVEVQIEKLTSHCGTNAARMRVNGNAWIPIPEPSGVPGTRGSGHTSILYNCMYYPKVQVPLSHFRSGTNRFEFDCQGAGGAAFGSIWPQFIVYGATFRVFYDQRNAHRHPTGKITSPRSGTVFGDAHPTFEVEGSTDIVSVEFLGDYDDYGWRGEERTDGWQYSSRYGQIINNIGDANAAPWQATWDTTWIPSQPTPFRVCARIKNASGYIYMTEAITGLTFARSKRVQRHRLTSIPIIWNPNYWAQEKKAALYLPSNITSREAVRMTMGTWNGIQAQEIGIGNRRFAQAVGKDHDLDWTSIDISRNGVQPGFNPVFTRCKLQDHGPEFLWPGIEVFIRYNEPEATAGFVSFGKACGSLQASPVITATGLPKLGQTYSLDMIGGKPNMTYWFILGAYHDRDRNGRPLPIELGFMGAPECYLHTAMHRVWSGLTDNNGKATLPIAIPNDPAFLRLSFFNQYATNVPGANSLEVLTTQGGRSLIGR